MQTMDIETQQQQSRRESEDSSKETGKSSKRSFVACIRCNKSKTKCNGETPCRNCQMARKPVECVYPMRDRKASVKQSYVDMLEEENRQLKRKRSIESHSSPQLARETSSLCTARHSSNGMLSPSQESHHSAVPPQQSYPADHITLDHALGPAGDISAPRAHPDESFLQPRYLGEASSETFGGRLHQYIVSGEKRPTSRPYSYYKNPKLHRISCTECSLPNKNYARLLVRAVLRFIGGDHHLLLKKSFLKRLDETYQLEVLDDPGWLCRLFTVLALGELYSARGGQKSSKGAGVPGTEFFVKAIEYFQDMFEEPTVSYIETLLLFSFYSVALNRRNTAYTYTGLALRLSLTLGLHRKIPKDSGMSAPEREHRIRVWWTCYALDRIYTSKIGLPIMLRDEDIDVQMPSMEGLTPEEAEDFYTPELMTAQIKLARITGNMITDLYNIPQPGKTNTFVQNVQRILTDLRSWHETLPEVLRLDFEAMPMYSSRSVASLHLHFGNTAMQTTRPILFHLFRQHFAPVSGTTTPREVLPITAALGESCVQAARTFSSILAQLWVDGSLAPFGYFDALSVFASTMILMMSAAMKEHDSNDDDAVETAWSLLRTMKEAGNIPAQGLTDQLTELRNDLDRLKERRKHKSNVTTAQRGDDTDGLGLLLAATGTFNHNRLPGLSGTSTPRAGAFGVSDAVGAFDDPFLQDFLQQPYRDWTAQNFGADPNEIPPGQLQFDWENANLFGSL